MSSANKRNTRKINVIDVIVILLVLALIATAVFKIYSEISNGNSNKQSNYIVSFECDSEYRSLLKYLKAGEAVYLSSNGTLLGYLYDAQGDGVNAVYEREDKEQDESESATDFKGEDSDPYIKVGLAGKLKLAADAVKSKSGEYYTIGETNISQGSIVEVYTAKAFFTLTVKSIDTGTK